MSNKWAEWDNPSGLKRLGHSKRKPNIAAEGDGAKNLLPLSNPLGHINNIKTLRTMRAIPERDWKLLRSMKPRVLEDACARILKAVESTIQTRDGSNHQAYLALWTLLKKEDASIALMFDDFKRSTGLIRQP